MVKSNTLVVNDRYRHQEVVKPTLEEDSLDDNSIPIAEFVSEYSNSLFKAASNEFPSIHDGTNNNHKWDKILDSLKRHPFAKQRDRIHASAKLLAEENECSVVINGEMGTGKTMMGICTAEILRQSKGIKRCLVICPPHLVYKWRREILNTVPDARVWILNGPDTLLKLIKLKKMFQGHEVPEYFIMGRVRMRMGFNWKPAFNLRKVVVENDSGLQRLAICACPTCGCLVKNEENELVEPSSFSTTSRSKCKQCNEQLWSLIRPGQKTFDRDSEVTKTLCKLPTIGKITAKKLIDSFGSESIASMMDDNVYEFIE